MKKKIQTDIYTRRCVPVKPEATPVVEPQRSHKLQKSPKVFPSSRLSWFDKLFQRSPRRSHLPEREKVVDTSVYTRSVRTARTSDPGIQQNPEQSLPVKAKGARLQRRSRGAKHLSAIAKEKTDQPYGFKPSWKKHSLTSPGYGELGSNDWSIGAASASTLHSPIEERQSADRQIFNALRGQSKPTKFVLVQKPLDSQLALQLKWLVSDLATLESDLGNAGQKETRKKHADFRVANIIELYHKIELEKLAHEYDKQKVDTKGFEFALPRSRKLMHSNSFGCQKKLATVSTLSSLEEAL